MKNTGVYGLSAPEKARLRKCGVKLGDINNYSAAELQVMLEIDATRAKEVHALAVFQAIPSIGIKFAEDLISIGYYSLEELATKDGPTLIHELETHCGYWIDPCVEDQCRLVVDYANNKDKTRNWWDFTAERKAYREQNGHPATRPVKPWYETLGYKKE